MWDGIWNAGKGIHDPTAGEWMDLVGGNNGVLNGNYQIDENCINFLDGTGYAAMAKQYSWFDSGGCVEFVVLPYGVKRQNLSFPFISLHAGTWSSAANNIVLVCWYNSSSPYWFPHLTTYYGPNVSVSAYWQNYNGGGMNGTPIAALFSKNTVYIEDALKTTGSNGNYYPNSGAFFNRGQNNTDGYAGKYYAVRIYSRTLTQEERTHNYNLDKERFGL